jgi:hypothetical protein
VTIDAFEYDVTALFSHSFSGLGLLDSGDRFSEENQARLISALYQFPESMTFCLAGAQASAAGLYAKIRQTSLSERLLVYFDNIQDHYDELRRSPISLMYHRSLLSNEPRPDLLLFYMSAQFELEHMRFYQKNLEGAVQFVFPFIAKQDWKFEIIENPFPLLLYFFPCAGSSRISAPLASILNHFRFLQRESYALSANQLYNFAFEKEAVSDFDAVGKYFLSQVKSLDYYQYMIIHDPCSLHSFKECKFLRKIALIRDPRDVVTSYYMREFVPQFGSLHLSPQEKEKALFQLVNDGFINRKKNYFLRWPNLQTLANFFVELTQSPNTLVVRFEDLHHRERESYQRILKWLGFDWHPLVDLSPEQLATYCRLGALEYQAQGGLRSADPEKAVVKNGVLTACRKGETGDWKNHFSSALASHCQELIGAQLKLLSYDA